MTNCEIESSIARLPAVESHIVGLRIGEIQRRRDGKAQVYFGGNGVEALTPYDQVEMRDGAIQVAMYTVDGRKDIDYAEITITPRAANRTPLEIARSIRGHGGITRPADFIERTPVQYFLSKRGFMDIPLSGRARWLALDPEGNFYEGIFDDRDPETDNQVAMFSEGWTFAWIVQSSRPFKFGEVCTPRFIDQDANYPLGEEGITELDLTGLRGEFADKFIAYTSGQIV